MLSSLEGRVAIATGAAQGIGAAIARALDACGSAVVVSDVTGGEREVADNLNNAIEIHCDVANETDVDVLISDTVERFGRLDILCNNAGVDGEFAWLGESSAAEFDRVLEINLRGVYLGMRRAIPAMTRTGGGSIVDIASIAAVVAFAGSSAYAASKAGVIGMETGCGVGIRRFSRASQCNSARDRSDQDVGRSEYERS
jgi:NAD(P)-dependent dehydrogenase (short-subunit alcohol dehydrogenase family)